MLPPCASQSPRRPAGQPGSERQGLRRHEVLRAPRPKLGLVLESVVQPPTKTGATCRLLGSEACSRSICGQAGTRVKDCADISDGLSAGAFLLELAEVALYVVWPGRDNALPSDAVLDMEAPHALVPCCGQRAQVLPAVVPPTCDGVVERSGWAPRSRRLIRNHLWNLVLLSHKVSEFALGGSPRAVKEPALVPNSPSGISFEVNAQLPSVGALVEPWSNAAGHHTSAGHQSQHLLGLKLGPTYQVGVTPSRLNLLAGIL